MARKFNYSIGRYVDTQENIYPEILKNFKMEKPKKSVFGNYRIEGNSLIYRTQETEEKRLCTTNTTAGKSTVLDQLNVIIAKPEFKHFINSMGEKITVEEARNKAKTEDYHCFKIVTSEENEVARKVTDSSGVVSFLGNSSILPLIGRTVAYGNVSYNRDETAIQRLMVSDDFVMIPFSVFTQAKLDLNKFRMIEKGPESKVTVKVKDDRNSTYDKITYRDETRHFTGASLFEVDGQAYLFDIDRREIKHKIFNPFLATIPAKPKTIEEAYQLLKPKAVLEAEKKGLKVQRQGEWFFIESAAPKIKKLSEIEKMILMSSGRSGINRELAKILGIDVKKLEAKSAKLLEAVPRLQNITAGNSRPNSVEMLLNQGGHVFCSGVVKHSGREHADLVLKGWWKAIPNTSVQNFTITGDID